MQGIFTLRARGIRAVFDAEQGMLARFEVTRGERIVAPYARVPWADDPDPGFPAGMPAHLQRMSGDFFCAPFCADDREGAPFHGWPANSCWHLVNETRLPDGTEARFRLDRRVCGATVEKVWRLRDDHPFLYQRHEFHGGSGAIPVAHHAMVDLRSGGRLAFSPVLHAETPAPGSGPERTALSYPARATDPAAFPAPGGKVDLTRLPFARRHEDFVMLVDDPRRTRGWATALRPAYGDVALLIKPVARLPQTMLWFSNGGRDAAPWSGRHVGVLGIELACALGAEGWSAAIAPNRLTAQGVATAIDLGAAPVVGIATALGALPTAASDPVALTLEADRVTLSDGTAAPFDGAWLE